MVTALLVLTLPWYAPDIPLIEAGQTSAPVCVEFCGGKSGE